MTKLMQSNFFRFFGALFLASSMQLHAEAGAAAAESTAADTTEKTFSAVTKEVNEGDVKGKYVERTYTGAGLSVLELYKTPQHKARSDELLMIRAFHLIDANDMDGFLASYAPAEREKIRAFYKKNPKAWDAGTASIKGADKVLIKHAFGLGNYILVDVAYMKSGKEVAHKSVGVFRSRKIYYLTQEASTHRLYNYVVKKYDLKEDLLPTK